MHEEHHRGEGDDPRHRGVEGAGHDPLEGDPEDGDGREQPLVHLAGAREVLDERHEHALDPRHHHRDGHEPGHDDGAELGGHEVHAGQEVAEDEDHEHGLGERADQHRRGVAPGDQEVPAQQGEERGHSRSSFPVKWT